MTAKLQRHMNVAALDWIWSALEDGFRSWFDFIYRSLSAVIYFLQFNNESTRKMSETCSELTINGGCGFLTSKLFFIQHETPFFI